MKNIIKVLALLAFALLALSPASAQNPTYALTVDGFSLNSPLDNELEFDIHIYQTNSPVPFEYAGGQFFFDFNTAITNGGSLTYTRVGTGLPANFEPRNPQISGNQLRLAVNTFPGAGNGFTGIPSTPPGVLIERMRITNTVQFAVENLNLAWRNGPANPFTKIFAYVGTTNTDITTAATHTVSNEITPLPVELASFTSNVDRNTVSLKWTTSSETNNKGFEIERRSGNDAWSRAGYAEGSGTSNEPKSYSFTERLSTGKYNYRLKQTDFNGSFRYYELNGVVDVGIPAEFAMSQNYPNPFNPSTKIDYDIPKDGNVAIALYDMSGREVAKLVNDFRPAGYYTVSFNGANLSSGMYFYRITSANFSQTKKMVLVK